MFEKNQYPPPFYEPIVENTMSKMLTQATVAEQNEKLGNLRERQARPTLLMEYRGLISDRFSRSIRKSTQACVLFTTRKMKTVLPSLKKKLPDDLKAESFTKLPVLDANSAMSVRRHGI